MNKIAAITMLWLLNFCIAYAEIPKVTLNVAALNATFPAQYAIGLTVPPDHHAYLDAGDENGYIPITFDADGKLAESELVIHQLKKPLGIYDNIVKALVLRDKGAFVLWLAHSPHNPQLLKEKIVLAVKYQLCNDLTHECFRPQTTQVDLTLPPVKTGIQSSNIHSNSTVTNTATDESLSFMDKLLALFKNNKDNLLMLFALMSVAGILSVATPCVYPMLPITSMFIINRANGVAKKEKQHAFVYLVGIVGTYMALGLIAGMTGGALNTFMQSAWVNLGFAVFFAFFAIALLGFYELGFMQNEVHSLGQHSARVKGLGGTWLMGTVAGLVISPCVGPIVFALLLQVADNIAEKETALALLNQTLTFFDKLTLAAQGSVMMAGFGIGVGLPFFLISVLKFKSLPKSGYWMNKIKYAFGFMILYFAYGYLSKGMGVLGAEPNVTLSLAVSLVMVWTAVVHCNVLTPLPVNVVPNQKMLHYLGVVTLIAGGWLMIASLGHVPLMGSAQATASDCQDTAKTANARSTIQEDAGILWYRSYEVAQKAAQQTGKPIFIDFYASWCANCIAFKAETINNKALNQALRERAIAVKLVDKEPEFETFRKNPLHRQLKIGLPYFAILSPQGTLIWSGTDYTATEKMIAVLTGYQLKG
ncbi:MAG: cytochrome c biogenesis protein CcdA [Methylovulum sp.]|nr:cytochrome c biogenesis protein CcdA [Methylovulum sp.]